MRHLQYPNKQSKNQVLCSWFDQQENLQTQVSNKYVKQFEKQFEKQNNFSKKQTIFTNRSKEPLKCWDTSNINELKKQAQLLDDENTMGSLRLVTNNLSKNKLDALQQHQAITETVTYFETKNKPKLNPRKIAKGRPYIYTQTSSNHQTKHSTLSSIKSKRLSLKTKNNQLNQMRSGSSMVVRLLHQFNKQMKLKNNLIPKNTHIFKVNNFVTIY